MGTPDGKLAHDDQFPLFHKPVILTTECTTWISHIPNYADHVFLPDLSEVEIATRNEDNPSPSPAPCGPKPTYHNDKNP